ncbi:MAG: glycoside hydrolase [Acidobacteriaceae bacterium]|nr:glycoside hydrolase [Acidobacteriaceae bacterium]
MRILPVCTALVIGVSALGAQSLDPTLFGDLKWRDIGPLRGGRTRALAGVPSQPSTFYIAQVNGGVFKTNDYGRTWNPIFDSEESGSIGAIAVAPSDPNIIYVGSGEGLQRPDLSTGNGIYKSVDGGKTWTHLGLRDGQQIPHIAVDPRNPEKLFVAVLGHPYGPNEERGIYRSTDGGQTFEKVLYKDENTGGNDVEIDPSNPDLVYATLWEARQGPWENAAWSGTGGGIFKSKDGGKTWQPLTTGLPKGDDGLVQANLAIAPSNTRRIFASVATMHGLGIYRSDDAGESWSKITNDPRPAARIGGGDLPVPAVDPQNADIVYSASVVTWKSRDGGKTWTGIRGAPGGDDYQGIWINPNRPEIMLVVSDQGAIVTVNGGETWSEWYNQPTAQMYHVGVDNAFPFHVCSGQQESGSACVSSRGNYGEITMREWLPVGVEEYGNAVPDPLDPNIVYGGKVTRFDRRTGQVQNIGPKPVRSGDYRTVRTAPLVFSPVASHTLFFGANTLWKTTNGGASWTQISPDLSRETWTLPPSVGKYRDSPSAQPTRRGVIYAVSPSPLDLKTIWAGTDDGLVHFTADGGANWKNVTPRALQPWAKVSIIDAGHFDRRTAYIAVNTFRLDDLRPHIYRTHDGGANWTEIVSGLPPDAPTNVVREDPFHKGLLFAGTERSTFVSFDDGDHWQPLRLNMPATSIRDLMIKDDDLIAATHGRGFWILDNISPLSQLSPSTAGETAVLFRPQTAIRIRWDMNTDTPLPPDTPSAQNPPDGAMVDYYLANDAAEVTLDILDTNGHPIRHYASSDPIPPVDPLLAIPRYWVRPPQPLSRSAGMHRFLWDMRFAPIPGQRSEYPMQAVFRDTPPASSGPWVMPGKYTARLTVDGQSSSQPLIVTMDPRVHTSLKDLNAQFTLSKQIYDELLPSTAAYEQIRSLRSQIAKRQSADPSTREKLEQFNGKLVALSGESGRFGSRGAPAAPDTLATVNGSLTGLLNTLIEADAAPTSQLVAAAAERRAALEKLMTRWNVIQKEDLTRLNSELRKASIPALSLLLPRDVKSAPPSVADNDEEDVQ